MILGMSGECQAPLFFFVATPFTFMVMSQYFFAESRSRSYSIVSLRLCLVVFVVVSMIMEHYS